MRSEAMKCKISCKKCEPKRECECEKERER